MKEKVILNRMKAGDEEAFAWLYNHYWQKVYHFARLYLTSSSEISEAVQDVFLHVWEARETFDNSKNFDGYLFIITRNIIFNYSRRYFNELNFKMTVLQSMEEGYSIEEELDARDLKRYIDKLVVQRPANRQRIFRMSRELHLSNKQIAEQCANDESVLEYVSRGQDISDTLNEKGVISLRLSGPLFFGGASQVSMFFRQMHDVPKVLIFRMGSVPVVDASGANILVEFIRKLKQYDTKIIFSHLKAQPRRVLHDALTKEGLIKDISTASSFENAVKMTKRYLRKLEADKTDKSVDF